MKKTETKKQPFAEMNDKPSQPNTNSRDDIRAKTDTYNPNHGPDHRSSKKKNK